MKVVLFRVGESRLALMTSEVREVLHLPALTAVPGTPPGVLGYYRAGRDVVPVVRLDRLLGLPEQPIRRNSPLVVLRREPILALLVEEVQDVVEVEPRALGPLAYEESLYGCAAATLNLGEGPASLLSGARLLSLDEERRLDELQVLARERMAAL